MTTALWDSQVQYFEPAKWVAKLRRLKTDDNVLLFRVKMGAPRSEALLRLLAAARPDTLVVVNSSRSHDDYAAELPGYHVLPVDGLAIARRNGLGRIVNSAARRAGRRA